MRKIILAILLLPLFAGAQVQKKFSEFAVWPSNAVQDPYVVGYYGSTNYKFLFSDLPWLKKADTATMLSPLWTSLSGAFRLSQALGATSGQVLKWNGAAWAPAADNTGSGGSAVSSVAGRTGDVVLSKSDVGLSNADNTSDANKPISAAAQTALNGKANTSHMHAQSDITGLLAAITQLSDSNNAHNARIIALDGKRVPAGGTTGQVLTKSSNSDYALGWTTPSGGGDANLVVQPIGSSGYATVVISGDTFYYRRFRDSSGIGISIAPDGALVFRQLSQGIGSLNGLTGTTQIFATGTTGTDFNISSVGSAHTINMPSASPTARGLATTAAQTFAGLKTFQDNIKVGRAGQYGRVEFGRQSDGATAGYVDVASGFMTLNGISGSRAVIQSNSNTRLLATNEGVSVGLGGNAPTYSFEVDWTDAMKLPKGSTVQRPTTTTSGIQRWNNDSSAIELHNGTIWQTIATRDWARSNLAGSTGGSFTYTLNKDSVIADAAAIPIGINPTTGRLARVPDQTVSLVRGTSGAEKDSIYVEIAGVASTDKAFAPLPMRWANTAFINITNTTTATSLFGSGVGSTTLPSLRAGDVLLVKLNGMYGTTTSSNTFAITLIIGGISFTHTLNFASSQSNKPFEIEIELTPQSNSSSSNLLQSMRSYYLDGSFVPQFSRWVSSSAGFDNTAALPVTLTGKWNVANASNSAIIYAVSMEVKKGNW